MAYLNVAIAGYSSHLSFYGCNIIFKKTLKVQRLNLWRVLMCVPLRVYMYSLCKAVEMCHSVQILLCFLNRSVFTVKWIHNWNDFLLMCRSTLGVHFRNSVTIGAFLYQYNNIVTIIVYNLTAIAAVHNRYFKVLFLDCYIWGSSFSVLFKSLGSKLFKQMLFFWTFYLSVLYYPENIYYSFLQKYWRNKMAVFNIDNKKCYCAINRHIRMISEGSCKTEDWWLLKMFLHCILKYIRIRNKSF